MKISLSEEQIKKINSKLNYETILDEMVFKLSIITEDEERTPDMEWDFTGVKKDIDLSSRWVKTKEDAIEFVNNLKDKISSLPKSIKQKILSYTLYSFLGLLTLNQIQNYLEEPLQKTVKIEKRSFKNIEDVRIRKSSENLFDHLKYEEGSIYQKGEPNLIAYDLGDGAYTIGYGHAIFPGENEGYDFLPKYSKIKPGKTKISKSEAETLLKDDIKNAEAIVNKILNDWESQGIKPKITQGMYDSMVSMAYNMGSGIRTTDFIQAVKRGDFDDAKKLILQTSEHLFDDYPGLKFRREKEAKMFA
jgi:GH24 family phage-related lysozyme (muramidase)